MTKIIILEGKTNFCLVYMQKLSVGVVARNHIKLLVFKRLNTRMLPYLFSLVLGSSEQR